MCWRAATGWDVLLELRLSHWNADLIVNICVCMFGLWFGCAVGDGKSPHNCRILFVSNYLLSDGRQQSRLRDKLGFADRIVCVCGYKSVMAALWHGEV